MNERNCIQKRILFVDDEPNVLQGLRRMLRPLRQEWDMAFAEGGHDALELLAQAPYDVVVSDMRMPGMNGAQLLIQVRERYPHIIRIVLSGHSDSEMILTCVGIAHQYLAKPCDAAVLKSTVTRACALRELLRDATLQRLVSGMTTLPSLPTIYHQIVETVQAPDSSLHKVGEIIGRDMSMTAKILQLVNSAFFGLGRQVSDPAQAVCLLGLDTIRSLVLSMHCFTYFDQTRLREFALDRLWEHSMATRACARIIARVEGCERQVADDAFIAGLLHDVGKLILAANLPGQYGDVLALVQDQEMAMWQAERATFGASHAGTGAYLLGIWGLPDAIVEALAFHHHPAACADRRFSPLTAVHVANALVHEADVGHTADASVPVDLEYLAALGLRERLADWRAHCQTALSEGIYT
jgi:HD-like signal output (HDOD) protein